MSFCPSCGVEVREGKAFCYNCGAPMKPSAPRRDDKLSPDLFKATVVVPLPKARPPQPQPPTGLPEMSGRAGRGARRKFFYGKFGLGVVVLLLLVILILFALAVLVD